MTVLMRATEIMKRPVVTLAGEDVAQIKDIIYESGGGGVAGFTLAGRGLFAGPMKQELPWAALLAVGRDAVMIRDESVLVDRGAVGTGGGAAGGNVLGSRVVTDDGTALGKVVEVILDISNVGDVVGYEIDPTEVVGKDGKLVLIPLPDTIAVSGEALMVPAAATEFVSDDLAGFGAAVEAFRARLAGGTP